MIADREKYEVQSTVTGDQARMTIDPEAMGHIMEILTDLYSDEEMAVIREYSTNALDAHREAGNKQPIEIFLPGPLSPLFMVSDHGCGLSKQDIFEIYSQYGNSTKRGTNDQVGMLGLGCKSALTYTEQFTVTSVKNGKRIQVAVSRDEEGAGTMTVQDESDTDDPDGTTIAIPAKSGNDFERKARAFFRWWEPGTVLINGKAPESFHGLKITDNIYVVENPDREHLVVMGGVPYPADLRADLASWNHKLVAFVGIGEVNFVPSREALRDSKRTKQTLARIEQEFQAGVVGALQREINAADTHHEALRIMAKWQNVLPSSARAANYTYNGTAIPRYFRAPKVQSPPDANGNVQLDGNGDPLTYHPDFIVSDARSYVMSRHSTPDKFPIESVPGAVFVTNYDRKTYTANVRKKLDRWVGENLSDSATHYICLDHVPSDLTWFDTDRMVDWSVVNAIKLPAPTRNATGRIPGSYDMFLPTTDGNPQLRYGIEANDIDASYPVYYFSGDKWEARRAWAPALVAGGYECTLVVMPSTRVAKFLRNFPNAKNVRDAIQERYDAWVAKINAADREAIAMEDEGVRDELAMLNADKVADPELSKAIKRAKRDIDDLLSERRAFRGLAEDTLDTKWTNPLERYPLFDSYNFRVDSKVKQHTYLYMNAAYSAGKGA